MRKYLASLPLLLLPVVSFPTTVSTWKIVPAASNLSFVAIQNGAPVKGMFQKFSGEIQGTPSDLKDSKVKIDIDVASVKTEYGEVESTLVTSDWFDVAHYPKAIFTADEFKETGKNKYDANGKLTMRGKTAPVTLHFVMEDYSSNQFVAKGSTMIKRTQFGVGQGNWSKTDAIKDEVEIDFTIKASKA